jgi:hypothetical protein
LQQFTNKIVTTSIHKTLYRPFKSFTMTLIKSKTWTASAILSILSIVVFSTGKAQQTPEKPSPDKSNIEGQFNYVYQQSTDFEDYKMVKKWWITRLKSHVLDSMKMVEDKLLASEKLVESRNAKIDSLNQLLAQNKSTLKSTIKEKNTLHLFGIPMDKAAYNSLVWTLIGGLIFTLALFIILYKRSHVVTVQTRDDLEEIKDEFEAFRKRALEREEGIVRKYHNELMHYKNKAGKV